MYESVLIVKNWLKITYVRDPTFHLALLMISFSSLDKIPASPFPESCPNPQSVAVFFFWAICLRTLHMPSSDFLYKIKVSQIPDGRLLDFPPNPGKRMQAGCLNTV